MNRHWLISILLGAALAATAQAEEDHRRSRRLVAQGEILPLQEIIARLAAPRGRVLEVELERQGARHLYEIELLDEDGQVWEYRVDAADGRVLDRHREE
ncbi:MAG: PepSY domain-containing protein [Candidatus Sedimenticola endophacoides]